MRGGFRDSDEARVLQHCYKATGLYAQGMISSLKPIGLWKDFGASYGVLTGLWRAMVRFSNTVVSDRDGVP